jgi:alanyl-tRNA synthetase
VVKLLEDRGFPFHVNRSVIPSDSSTLFTCSGMQNFKTRFGSPDLGRLSTLQSCIRTDDIDLVGDGTHLTSFGMIGNFSFGNDDYPGSVDLWHQVVTTLSIPISRVHVHPTQDRHRQLWERLGYTVRLDPECEWSDGNIGGFCCEMYSGDLEIGNLVHTRGVSTDVGFGWERLVQVVEGKRSVHESSLFDPGVDPVIGDHVRTISLLRENGIHPGNRGREYVCRRLIRRVLRLGVLPDQTPFSDWMESESKLQQSNLEQARKMWKKHRGKSDQWWWESVGIMPEEIARMR